MDDVENVEDIEDEEELAALEVEVFIVEEVVVDLTEAR